MEDSDEMTPLTKTKHKMAKGRTELLSMVINLLHPEGEKLR
jgi:hypothetical protein